MDKKELRESLGTTTHYKPALNQNAPKQGWLTNMAGKKPLQVKIRGNSFSEDSTSPVGSPQSPTEFNFTQIERRNSKNAFKSFGFTN